MIITIGTRGSKLAMKQAMHVKGMLEMMNSENQYVIKVIETTGDLNPDVSLSEMKGTGVFVKRIEECLLAGEIDIAVHSMKDMSTTIPDGLYLCKAWKGEDPRDVFVRRRYTPVERIATGSARRIALMKEINPNLEFVDIRGNIDTRLRIMEEKKYDGLIIAAAGLHRLQIRNLDVRYLEPKTFIPACTQGILGIEVREEDVELRQLIERKADYITQCRVIAERSFLATLGGNCKMAMAAHLVIGPRYKAFVYGMLGSEDGRFLVKGSVIGEKNEAKNLGIELAEKLLKEMEEKRG